MRWYITKKALVLLIGLLVAVIFLMALTSCIPVTVRPQFDDQGLPIALPVTPTGSVSVDGTLTPIYEISAKAPTAFNWGAIGTAAGAILTALLAAYGINLRGAVSKTSAALRIACQLADDNAAAETDAEVERNKRMAESLQIRNGVQAITQKARGK